MKSNKLWNCPACVNVTRRRGDNTNTPVRRHGFNESLMSCDNSIDQSDLTADHEHVTLRQISHLLDTKFQKFKQDMFSEIKTIVKMEVQSAITELKSELNETVGFLEDGQKQIKSDLKSVSVKVQELDNEKVKLENNIRDIDRRIKANEMLSRSNNLEIQNVPENRNENVVNIFKKLCEVIGHSVSDSDVHACRRIAKLDKNSSRPRNIVVTLPSPRHRDTILSAVRRFNKANPSDPLNSSLVDSSGTTGTKQKIYVVEHLSPECKKLHAAARKQAKEKSYTFVWVKFGQVYVRKNEQSPAILVRDLDGLNKLA